MTDPIPRPRTVGPGHGLAAGARWRARGLVAALGALAALGQAPLGLWVVTLPALAVIFARVVAAPRARTAGALALWAGAGHFATAMFWIVEPFMVEPERDGWMAPFALPMMAFGMALFWALPAMGAHRLGGEGDRGRAGRLAALAVLLALSDLLRGYIFTGFPWALFGHVWIGSPVAQLAALGGPVALSLLTVGLAALAAAAPRRGGLAAVAIVAAAWAGGAWRLSTLPGVAPDAPVIRLVQPNAAQALKWLPGMPQHFFERLLALTAQSPEAGRPRPDLVLWPETSVAWPLNDPGPVLGMIADAAGGPPVVVGIQREEGRRYYNSLAVIGPGGAVGAVYDKHHLVPFGEYIPFGDLAARFGITAFAAQMGSGYSAGPGPQIIDFGGAIGPALPLICYEAVFPQDILDAPGRPRWLLQATNDAWFGSLAGPYQHLAQARLRAVEQGLPLLRVANTGVSAVIDAGGRVLASLPLDTEGMLDARLPPSLAPTPYARTGDLPVAGLLLVALAGLVLRRRRQRD
ncbi:apolipoprotein N-acyltransferase [Frigidibacter sp. MR17.24]|uniref:apolipoprotein N-acyltransferase n=1 Tax=Frigidibacter sp. MR17.24 TaxID=3127345 RepID=UPI003012A989